MTRPAQWLAKQYPADLRSLALMRMGVALAVIVDLIIRLPDLGAHYTGDGMWPASMLRFGWREGYWSFHAVNDQWWWQAVLFGLHFLAAAFLLAGWHTTRATFVTWLLLVSLHNRNVFILQGGDDLLRLVLFAGIFLPWGHQFSFDGRHNRTPALSSHAAYLLYLTLIACVYLFSALLKNSADWHGDGTAVYYALSLEQIRLPYSGDWLYRHPGLMQALTWVVIAIECLVPVLILLPVRNRVPRNLAVILVVLLHAGIAATLYVGLFPLIGMVTAIGLWRRKNPAQHTPFVQPGLFQWTLRGFLAVVICIFWLMNLESLPAFGYRLHRSLQAPVQALRLNQNWGMFSPSVLRKDGWFVYQGVDSLGGTWDLRTGQKGTDFGKPSRIVSMYRNDRWRKLAEYMQGDLHTFLRPMYAGYCLKKWNREHPEKQMQWLHLYYMEKINQPGYRCTGPEKVLYCISDGR